MLRALAGRVRRMISPTSVQPDASLPDAVSLRDMVRRLALIPHWEDKIAFARGFDYEAGAGRWTRLPASARTARGHSDIAEKIHYGCGSKLIDGWLNVDWHESTASGYRQVNLLETHPFDSDSVKFGFSEDMLEHFGQAESIFDEFWNGTGVIPLSALAKARPGALQELRVRAQNATTMLRDHPYLKRVRASSGMDEFLSGAAMHWPDRLQVLSDPADKVEGGDESRWLVRPLAEAMLQARKSLHLVSPYFVPGDRGLAALRGMRARGVDVEVLTNSLAATDVLAVHSGYASYRKPLLQAGVVLYELKPGGTRDSSSLFGSSGASLHTKAFSVDGDTGFIGSFNMDPRSVSLNTEMGVLFRDADTAAALERVYRDRTDARHSYRVRLQDGALRWDDMAARPPVEWDVEPETSAWQRAAVTVLGWLPIESLL